MKQPWHDIGRVRAVRPAVLSLIIRTHTTHLRPPASPATHARWSSDGDGPTRKNAYLILFTLKLCVLAYNDSGPARGESPRLLLRRVGGSSDAGINQILSATDVLMTLSRRTTHTARCAVPVSGRTARLLVWLHTARRLPGNSGISPDLAGTFTLWVVAVWRGHFTRTHRRTRRWIFRRNIQLTSFQMEYSR